jgi:hypothetical protein
MENFGILWPYIWYILLLFHIFLWSFGIFCPFWSFYQYKPGNTGHLLLGVKVRPFGEFKN